MKQEDIFRAISHEREKQDLQWGGKAHDHQHTWQEWDSIIGNKLQDATAYHDSERVLDYRRILHIAAICVALLELEDPCS